MQNTRDPQPAPSTSSPDAAPADTLTRKQRDFISEYLKDGNASAAARRAGYAGDSADVAGPRLLQHPAILKALAPAQAERDAARKNSLHTFTDNLEAIARFNPIDLIEPGTNRLRKLSDIPADAQQAMLIKLTGDRTDPDAPVHIASITTRDKIRALGLLIKTHSPPKPPRLKTAPLHERIDAFGSAANARKNQDEGNLNRYMATLVGEGHSPAIYNARINAFHAALAARKDGNNPEMMRLLCILLADPSEYTPADLASIPPLPVVSPDPKPTKTTTPPPKTPAAAKPDLDDDDYDDEDDDDDDDDDDLIYLDQDRKVPLHSIFRSDDQSDEDDIADIQNHVRAHPESAALLAELFPGVDLTPHTLTPPPAAPMPAAPAPTETLTPEKIHHLQRRALAHPELMAPLTRRYSTVDFSPAALAQASAEAPEKIPTNPNKRACEFPSSSNPGTPAQSSSEKIPTNPNKQPCEFPSNPDPNLLA